MQQPNSWDEFARDLAQKQFAQRRKYYCVNCGKPIVLIRTNTPQEQAIRNRQIAMNLCWECAGGNL